MTKRGIGAAERRRRHDLSWSPSEPARNGGAGHPKAHGDGGVARLLDEPDEAVVVAALFTSGGHGRSLP